MVGGRKHFFLGVAESVCSGSRVLALYLLPCSLVLASGLIPLSPLNRAEKHVLTSSRSWVKISSGPDEHAIEFGDFLDPATLIAIVLRDRLVELRGIAGIINVFLDCCSNDESGAPLSDAFPVVGSTTTACADWPGVAIETAPAVVSGVVPVFWIVVTESRTAWSSQPCEVPDSVPKMPVGV